MAPALVALAMPFSIRKSAVLLRNRVHDRIKGWAWTHRFSRLLLIGMIIPAHIDRFSLAAEQLGHNLGLIFYKLFGYSITFRFEGAVLAAMIVALPLLYLPAKAGFAAVEREQEDSAAPRGPPR